MPVKQHFSEQTPQNSISYSKKAGFNSSCGAPPMFTEQAGKNQLKKFGADRRRSNDVQLNSADGPGRRQVEMEVMHPVEFAS